VGINSDIDWRGRSNYLGASGGIAAVSSHAGFDLRNIQTFYETRKTTKITENLFAIKLIYNREMLLDLICSNIKNLKHRC
jgi:hypothetical protein